ncbi:putative uncharacterized protein DDB_G0294196 [Oncorhynchus keta]|uniref:putative uncharacterized protein DDB_G0294196 n=1 Tax=Oncorhynchus keta TaxID=8018 RepID=UPI00227B4592|nr:putative uncharacterized protein DDB_G0294196 [Oncorhynchus keta]
MVHHSGSTQSFKQQNGMHTSISEILKEKPLKPSRRSLPCLAQNQIHPQSLSHVLSMPCTPDDKPQTPPDLQDQTRAQLQTQQVDPWLQHQAQGKDHRQLQAQTQPLTHSHSTSCTLIPSKTGQSPRKPYPYLKPRKPNPYLKPRKPCPYLKPRKPNPYLKPRKPNPQAP